MLTQLCLQVNYANVKLNKDSNIATLLISKTQIQRCLLL